MVLWRIPEVRLISSSDCSNLKRPYSIDKVPKITSPVLVIHGTEDEVIDFSHGLAIHEKCPRAVDPLWVEGAGHNDVELYGQYLDRLRLFIERDLPHSQSSWLTLNCTTLCIKTFFFFISFFSGAKSNHVYWSASTIHNFKQQFPLKCSGKNITTVSDFYTFFFLSSHSSSVLIDTINNLQSVIITYTHIN